MGQRLPQWELTLIVLTLAAAAWSATLSPYYLSVGQILYSTRQFVYPGILSIGLAVVVILSEIDISLASTLAFEPPPRQETQTRQSLLRVDRLKTSSPPNPAAQPKPTTERPPRQQQESPPFQQIMHALQAANNGGMTCLYLNE